MIDHLEGPREAASGEIYDQVANVVRLADDLGVRYAWFAEHHAHAHEGHLPAPLLFALHLAGQTQRIHLGTAIICLNLHHPLDMAEQIAVADLLSNGRIAPGFGSGSTDEEFKLFGLEPTNESERHGRFEQALARIQQAWNSSDDRGAGVLPRAAADLNSRSWLAVNSVGAAKIAGRLGFNMLFSHLRTVQQYHEYFAAYRAAGGKGRVAANRPVFVANDDATATTQIEPALRILWRRFRDEGKISRDMREPRKLSGLCAHPINFLVGSPSTVAMQLRDLHEQFPFELLNIEVRWAGLSHEMVLQSLNLFMIEVMPRLR